MCDVGSFLAIGAAILTSGGGGGGGRYDAQAGEAAIRGIELEERRFEQEEPFRKRALEAGIEAIGRQEQLAEREMPLQLQVLEEASVAGSPEEQEAAAARAAADARAAIDAGAATRGRTLRSYGIKPGDPAFTAGKRAAAARDAATLAKATTDAREGERARGQEQRVRVGGQARGFNPNVPLGSSPGNITSAANTLSRIGARQFEQDQSQRAAIGQSIGTISERYFPPRPLSSVPAQSALSNSYNSTPFTYSGFPDYEKGGRIEGPPHTDGGVPIEAEGGEYIIKAETVQKYGPRLLREVNEGTAIIIPTGSPRKLKAVA